MLTPGTYLEYFKDKKLTSAVCLRQGKPGQIFVRALKGREEKLQESKAFFTIANFISPNSDYDDIDDALLKASRQREELAASLNLSELWELICDEPADKLWSLEELCELSFGEATAVECSAAYRALENDRIYFNRKGDCYVVRSESQVKELLYSQQREAESRAEREVICRWLDSLWKRSQPCTELSLPAGSEAAARKTLESLADVAMNGVDSCRYREVNNLLSEINIGKRGAPFSLLVKAGYWSQHENLLLHKLGVSTGFDEDIVEEAKRLAASVVAVPSDKRQDLRHLACFTIDSISTTDLDDAISYELLDNGNYRVGIHIADVAECIPEDSPLDRDAFYRGTAIYMPDLKIPMVPSILSDTVCSLIVGQDRLAMSFLAEFTPQAELVASQITPSVIRVSERLTYEMADQAIEENRWPGLMDIIEELRYQRREQGAMMVPFPRVNVTVSPEGEIIVSKESPNQPSQKLVSELMILTNRLAAEALHDKGFPVIYRSQNPPEKPIDEMAEFDPAKAYACKRFMHRGQMGTEVASHAGLGLEYYTQATSPIRRYNDLVMQRQLKSLVRGEEPRYSVENLQECLTVTKSAVALADQLERDRRNYWILCYLEKQVWQEVEACVVANHPDKHIIQLCDTLWETECALVPKHPMPPGTRLLVRIELVWPRDQTVNVSPVIDEEAE